MAEKSISIICDEIKKHTTIVIASYTSLLKTGEKDVDNRILSEIIDFNLKNKDPNFSELINEFTPKNMFKTAQILLERGEKKNAIKILQNCMIKCCSDKDENNIVKDETTLKACFDKFKELRINLLDNFEPIKKIRNFTSENSKIIETYLKIAEFSIEDSLRSVENIDKIFLNISKTIGKINGNFLVIDENGKDKDILNDFYANFTQLNPELFTTNLSCNCIKMYQTFVLKGSHNILGNLLKAYEYLEQKKGNSKEITKLISNKVNLMMEFCDKYEYHDGFRLLLPYLFEKGDRKNVKKYFDKYCNVVEQLKNSNNSFNKKAYYEVAEELIRLIDGIARNLHNFPFVIDRLEDLCDNFPYKFDYGNAITTDQVNISLSRIEFEDFTKDVSGLKNTIEKNKEEMTSILNEKTENFKKSKEKEVQILVDKIENDTEILDNKIKDFFNKIENGYLDYSFILNNIDKFEKIGNLSYTTRGRTREIIKNGIQKQFEEKINSLNELFSKEKTEDRNKKINRGIVSLAKLIGKEILTKKYDLDLESNKLAIKNFFDNLEVNNDVIQTLYKEKFKEEFEKIKIIIIEKNKTVEENKEELEQTEKSVTNSIEQISSLDKPIETQIMGNP